MNPANAAPGGAPRAPHARSQRSSESHTRSASAPSPSAPTPNALASRGGWGRCEEATPPEPLTAARQRPSPHVEEPRTGVVRRMDARRAAAGSVAAPSATARPASSLRAEGSRESPPPRSAGEWRCLDASAQPSKRRRARRSSKVTIAQLSKNGDLVRHNGPDAWLPEAGDFVQRMSRLLAQGLGFERCRCVCLKNASSVLTVAEAGDTKVVAVSGPVRSMTNVLKRAGIE